MRPSRSWLLRGALGASLGASLALNLVLGYLLQAGPQRGPDVDRAQARIERVLSEPDRLVFHRAMEAGRPEFQAALREHRQGRPAVAEALAAEPFDPEALRAAMAQSRARWQSFSTSFENSMIQGFAAMSPEGRRRVAEDMRGRGGQRSGQK
ncbi:periplasmic heavy metal sensor [Teichococcus aerofrigidensis]